MRDLWWCCGAVSGVNEEDDGEKMEVLRRGGSAGDGGSFLCCCCAERNCREEDELRFDGGRWWRNSGELIVEGAAMAEARGRTHGLLQIGGGRRDWRFPA